MKETLDNLKQVVETFIKTTNNHNEILERQADMLNKNMINKDCKSKIYENIKEIEDEQNIQKHKIEKIEKNLEQINMFLKGDGCYSKGLINEIKELKGSINEIKDFVKDITTTKKNIKIFYNFLSGAGGAVLMIIIQKFFI